MVFFVLYEYMDLINLYFYQFLLFIFFDFLVLGLFLFFVLVLVQQWPDFQWRPGSWGGA